PDQHLLDRRVKAPDRPALNACPCVARPFRVQLCPVLPHCCEEGKLLRLLVQRHLRRLSEKAGKRPTVRKRCLEESVCHTIFEEKMANEREQMEVIVPIEELYGAVDDE